MNKEAHEDWQDYRRDVGVKILWFSKDLSKDTCLNSFQKALVLTYPFEIVSSFTVEGGWWQKVEKKQQVKWITGDLECVDSEKKVRSFCEV